MAFGPRALLAAGSPALARTAWGRSLRAGAAVLVARDDRLVLAFDISADPSGLSRASLPIVGGVDAPRAAGRGPVVAAVRSPAQTLSFLRSAGLLPALDVLSRAPGFLRPDLSDLGPQATIVAADERTLTVRMTPPDPGDWSTKLARLDALSGLIRFAGLADVRIDRATDSAYTIESDGALVGRVGVYERVVVFSTDPRADLRAAASAPPAQAVPGAAGALTLHVAPSLFGAYLPALARGIVAEVTGWARAEPSSLRGELAPACGDPRGQAVSVSSATQLPQPPRRRMDRGQRAEPPSADEPRTAHRASLALKKRVARVCSRWMTPRAISVGVAVSSSVKPSTNGAATNASATT